MPAEPASSLDHGFPLSLQAQRLELMLTMPPGVYHFRCPIKGHHGMQGHDRGFVGAGLRARPRT